MHRLQDLVRLHRQGLPDRTIARLLHMGRNTVSRYREAVKAAGLLEGDPQAIPDIGSLRRAVNEQLPAQPPTQQQSSVERWLPIIDQKYEQGVGPKAIHDFLCLNYEDFEGSLSAVKRRCARLKQAQDPREEDVAIPVETDPGDVAQVDFGYVGQLFDPDEGRMRKAWVFVMTLGYSRHMTARIVFDQKVATWLRVHIECFEEFGGVPKTVVPDNLKAAVLRAAFGADGETELNRSYRELARHYGFIVDPTPPRSPEKKGKVESSVRYIKYNYFKAHAPKDIRDARQGLALWLTEIAGKRQHGTTCKQPAYVFETEEKAQLHPLPKTRLDLLEWKEAKVHRDCHVVFLRELYSVPWPLMGEKVDLRVTKNRVTIYHKDEHVWVHDRVEPGKRSTVEEHLPDNRSYLRKRSRDYWETQAYALGQAVGDFVREIFDADDVLSSLRRVQQIVTHLKQFPRERACAACARAHHFGNYSYAGIKDILRRGLDFQELPHRSRLLSGHWSNKPRFSRVPTRPKDDDTRSELRPEEAPPVRRPRDDGPSHTAGH